MWLDEVTTVADALHQEMRKLALDISFRTGFVLEDENKLRWGFQDFLIDDKHSLSYAANSCLDWYIDLLSNFKPSIILLRAPSATGRKENDGDDFLLLFGMPLFLYALARRFGVNDIRRASIDAVRRAFLGRQVRRTEAKQLMLSKCNNLGFNIGGVEQVANAIALHHCLKDKAFVWLSPREGIFTEQFFKSVL